MKLNKTFLYGAAMWALIVLYSCAGCEYNEIIQPEVRIIDSGALADSIVAPDTQWGFVTKTLTINYQRKDYVIRQFLSNSACDVSCYFLIPPGDWGIKIETQNGPRHHYRTAQYDTIIPLPDYPVKFTDDYYYFCELQQGGNWSEVK